MQLPIITIPQTELRVSALCYGAAPYGTVTQGDQMEHLFDQYRAAGGNFFDTAHCYCFWLEHGDGASERALGDLVRRHGVREQVVIATKGGHPSGGEQYQRPDAYMSPDIVARDVDESLQRLGLEYVDLYYLHRDDPRMAVGDIIEMLNVEIRRGRIRYIGASNWPATRIAEANAYAASHGLQGFVVSEIEWNLAQSNGEITADPTMRYMMPDDLRWYESTRLPVIAYTSSALGYFAGSTHPRTLATYDNAVSRCRRDRVQQLADTLGCTPGQLALAWLLHQRMVTIPIIGTVNPDHLADAFGAVQVILTDEQQHWLTGD